MKNKFKNIKYLIILLFILFPSCIDMELSTKPNYIDSKYYTMGLNELPFKNDPQIVMAVCETETNCKHYQDNGTVIKGDNNKSIGIMQIGPSYYAFCGGKSNLYDPYFNILCGDEILYQLILKYGKYKGIKKYNGTGEKADNYAKSVLSKIKQRQ